MKRAPWILAAIALIAFGVTYVQLQKARQRYFDLAGFQSRDHLHREVREFIIRAALDGVDHPIVVLGDSITEMSRLPETINGTPVVNAGIGGAMIADFEIIAPVLLRDVRPSLIVVALGANNIGSATAGRDYADLLAHLKTFCPHLLAVAVTPLAGADRINAEIKAAATDQGVRFVETPVGAGSLLPDGIHLNADGYREWTPAVVAAIEARD